MKPQNHGILESWSYGIIQAGKNPPQDHPAQPARPCHPKPASPGATPQCCEHSRGFVPLQRSQSWGHRHRGVGSCPVGCGIAQTMGVPPQWDFSDNGISPTMGFLPVHSPPANSFLPGLSPSVTFITIEQQQRFPLGDKAIPGLGRISGQTFPCPQTAPRAPLPQEKLLALLPVALWGPRHGLSSP